MAAADGPRVLTDAFDVSRETLDRLTEYVARLAYWQARINLVGPSTLPQVWRRHILDSAQVIPHLGAAPGRILDLGSGAGFPGLVIALMLGDALAEPVTLVEADSRKCAFLREVIRRTGAPAEVCTARIEAARIPPADTLTARALAPLSRLLDLAANLAHERTRAVFLKGQDIDNELTTAAISWNIEAETKPSLSDPNGRVLIIERFSRV